MFTLLHKHFFLKKMLCILFDFFYLDAKMVYLAWTRDLRLYLFETIFSSIVIQ